MYTINKIYTQALYIVLKRGWLRVKNVESKMKEKEWCIYD